MPLKTKSLVKESFEFKETRGLILSDSKEAIELALSSLRENREKLERYVRKNPKFLYSLTPIKIDNDAPHVVRIMAEAASKAGVGPMAAVAGALADLAVREMGGRITATDLLKYIPRVFRLFEVPSTSSYGTVVIEYLERRQS